MGKYKFDGLSKAMFQNKDPIFESEEFDIIGNFDKPKSNPAIFIVKYKKTRIPILFNRTKTIY